MSIIICESKKRRNQAFFTNEHEENDISLSKWAPDPIINGLLTLMSSVTTPVTDLFSAIKKGAHWKPHESTGSGGPSCMTNWCDFLGIPSPRCISFFTRPSTTPLFESLSCLVVFFLSQTRGCGCSLGKSWCVVGQLQHITRRFNVTEIYLLVGGHWIARQVLFRRTSTCRMYIILWVVRTESVRCVFEGSRNLLTKCSERCLLKYKKWYSLRFDNDLHHISRW